MSKLDIVVKDGVWTALEVDGHPISAASSAQLHLDARGLFKLMVKIPVFDANISIDDCEVEGLPTDEGFVKRAHKKLDVVLDDINKTLDAFRNQERNFFLNQQLKRAAARAIRRLCRRPNTAARVLPQSQRSVFDAQLGCLQKLREKVHNDFDFKLKVGLDEDFKHLRDEVA